MAGGLLEYSGLVTKTKAMRARLLGADDYTAISEYESVTDFIAFLREQPAYAPVFERHGEVAHRGQVEHTSSCPDTGSTVTSSRPDTP